MMLPACGDFLNLLPLALRCIPGFPGLRRLCLMLLGSDDGRSHAYDHVRNLTQKIFTA